MPGMPVNSAARSLSSATKGETYGVLDSGFTSIRQALEGARIELSVLRRAHEEIE